MSMHQPIPRFKPGDSVVYVDEVYTVADVVLLDNGIYYKLKETDKILPEKKLKPYEPEMIIEVFLDDDLLMIGDRVTVEGYRGEFEIIGSDVVYYVQHTATGNKMFAAEEKVTLIEEKETKEDENVQTIDELLDEANDYRRLYEQFGDVRYKYAEQAAYEKLRKLRGEGSE